MSTIVFHHGALGDSVLVWPVLRSCGNVTFVAPHAKAKLAATWLSNVEAVDADAPDHARMFAGRAAAECSDAWRARLAEASTIISFVSDGRDAWAHNTRQMAPDAVLAFVPPRPDPDDPPMHVTDFHRSRVRDAGVRLAPLDIPPPRRNLDGPVMIHPGSGGQAKRWPLERFIAVLEHCSAIGRPTVAVLGEVELETWPDDDVRLIGSLTEVATPGSMIEMSRMIAGAAVYIGNDSGPTHLAGQLGVHTIALFGPTDPHVWSPIGPLVRVIAPPEPRPMDWLEPMPVLETLARLA